MRILDFGSSSRRVVRVLASAYPEVEWHACNPNTAAIEWADRNIPAVQFATSPVRPPLSYSDASFDALYAISISSHFGEEAALAWLDEMHRIIRPGGHLVLTTHGFHTVAFYGRQGVYPDQRLQDILDALYGSGYWFEPVFGQGGDAGVVDSGWGMSFLTPEWLLTRALPHWSVVEFAPGRNERNQDVFVLERAVLNPETGASPPEPASSNAMTQTVRSPGSRR